MGADVISYGVIEIEVHETTVPTLRWRPNPNSREDPEVAQTEPYDSVLRTAQIIDQRDGTVVFDQPDVEVPRSWSQNATNILAQKYFRGTPATPERETSLYQVVQRIVGTITAWGHEDGYFGCKEEAADFEDTLSDLLISQKAAFNSPVWFNIGVDDVPQQASACFILSVEDDMESILDWYKTEGLIFKGGSGAGVNLSAIRASTEPLRGGGTASGPVSFMRGADASAGAIKSGGKTRRAAKMVQLDADHPDIFDFIWCKAEEERKVRSLAEAGFDMSIDGAYLASIQYQNANNSVRVTDEFMEAVMNDGKWNLTTRTGGDIVRTVQARELFKQICAAAWECADPGLQFDTTINGWHTTPAAGRINASNPCSEYVHLDNSACNLASINLLKFLGDDGVFAFRSFANAVHVLIGAQDILVGHADYPTTRIGDNARNYRQLGLGYANLGALLMCMGLPYDSHEGREIAATITALMTGQAYLTSAKLASVQGPFAGYAENRKAMLDVLDKHKAYLDHIDASVVPSSLYRYTAAIWDKVVSEAKEHGVRNSQATVLAPTGTIGLLMDCDTTGIEPDLMLVKTKHLSGGGTMTIVNRSVRRALRKLGYEGERLEEIICYIEKHHTALGIGLPPDHLEVFACSLGENFITPLGHTKMMAAVQPFLSGAISKTVNLPENATREQIGEVFFDAWKGGLKSIAVYRDKCKVAQPLTAETEPETKPEVKPELARRKLPQIRRSCTFEFNVGGCKGFVTTGEYDDGTLGELFIRVSKQGSTLAGIMDAFAISVSHGLQHGVPLQAYVKALVGMRFEPAGITDHNDVRLTTSLIDFLFRKLAAWYLTPDERVAAGVRDHINDDDDDDDAEDLQPVITSGPAVDAPFCTTCGMGMARSGSCHVCAQCGTTSGCS